MENVTIACPIVYGTIAFYLGKKAEEFHTHRWTLYVRGPNDEDLSIFVEKVAFTLHPSFEQQVRVVEKPPFEITETGWGEFEVGIRIYFKDPEEQPIDIFHQLRLYPPIAQQQLNVKKPVVAENYDEIIFYAPNPTFANKLMLYGQQSQQSQTITATSNNNNNPSSSDAMDVVTDPVASSSSTNPNKPTAFPEFYTPFDDNVDCELLLSIKEHLEKEIIEAKNRLVNVEAEYVDFMNRKLQDAATTATTAASNASSVNIASGGSAPSTSSNLLLPSSSNSSIHNPYDNNNNLTTHHHNTNNTGFPLTSNNPAASHLSTSSGNRPAGSGTSFSSADYAMTATGALPHLAPPPTANRGGGGGGVSNMNSSSSSQNLSNTAGVSIAPVIT